MPLPLSVPVLPQLAKTAKTLPTGDGWVYEQKWDGFRAIAFVDGDDVYLQSRNGRPLSRYFPELEFPQGRYVLDGEIVLFDADGRQDFDALGQRIHPAESRIRMLAEARYCPGERVGMVKIKRVRTIDAVVMGWRPGKEEGTVGSLILGLYDDEGDLRVVGHSSGFKAAEKRELPAKLAAYETGERGRGDPSRWNNERELEWIALRPELVVEVTFDHVSNNRIRHGTKVSRWRDDKRPEECRTEQLQN